MLEGQRHAGQRDGRLTGGKSGRGCGQRLVAAPAVAEGDVVSGGAVRGDDEAGRVDVVVVANVDESCGEQAAASSGGREISLAGFV